MILKNSQKLLNDLNLIIPEIYEEEINKLKEMIYNSKRLFFAGAGRSGLMLKSVAMRFMQYGFEVYIVGETNTPSFKPADILITASGSGETETTILYAKKASKIGGKTAVITTNPESTLAQISDQTIKIPVSKLFSEDIKSLPGGSYFEIALLIFGDALALNLAGERESTKENLRVNHANLE